MRHSRALLFWIILLLPLVAEAAGAPRTLRELARQVVNVLSAGVFTLVALAIVIYVWGIASNMMKLGEGDPAAYRAYIFWGIVILFVMVSIWGILRLIQETIFQGGDASGNPVGSIPVLVDRWST